MPALIFSRDYLADAKRSRPLVALCGLFLISLIGVVVARDPSLFLASWELMTLVPATAILVRRNDATVRHAVYVYLAVTHLGGVGVWICVLALAHYGALGNPAALAAHGSALQAFIVTAAIIGFGTKAGLMPLHSWLPRAHPVAPSHISALMSGVMIKVALYGLIRVLFEWAAPPPMWVGFVVLGLGLLSSLGGVLYALMQRDLKRLLAFSSIENVGIVALGLGASILFSSQGDTTWAAIAFAAALLHIVNHAVFKALLFLVAGAFERAVGSLDLDQIGGLLRRMPWTGGAFFVGSMAIAGLPPLNGFASEWLTLQALIHVAIGPSHRPRGGRRHRSGGPRRDRGACRVLLRQVGRSCAAGAAAPGGGGGAVEAPRGDEGGGGVPGRLLCGSRRCPRPADPVVDAVRPAAAEPGGRARPRDPGHRLAAFSVVAVRGPRAHRTALEPARLRRRAPVPSWACGQRIEPSFAGRSAGFTKPLRLTLEAVFGRGGRSSRYMSSGQLQSLRYRNEIPHLFDTLLYRPVQRGALRGALVARRLQSGSVRAYAAYLLALLLALLVLARIGAIG